MNPIQLSNAVSTDSRRVLETAAASISAIEHSIHAAPCESMDDDRAFLSYTLLKLADTLSKLAFEADDLYRPRKR